VDEALRPLKGSLGQIWFVVWSDSASERHWAVNRTATYYILFSGFANDISLDRYGFK